jgi:hypothetical protein
MCRQGEGTLWYMAAKEKGGSVVRGVPPVHRHALTRSETSWRSAAEVELRSMANRPSHVGLACFGSRGRRASWCIGSAAWPLHKGFSVLANGGIVKMRRKMELIAIVALLGATSTATAGITMQGITMQGINLQGTELQGMTLQGPSSNGTEMQGIEMQGTEMQGTEMQGTEMQGISMQGRTLQGTSPNTPTPQKVGAPSTGLTVKSVHVVGGQLFF